MRASMSRTISQRRIVGDFMFEMTVGRHLSQCRSVNGVREHIKYLADLPRSIAFAIHSIHVDAPVRQGQLWYYRAIIRYAPNNHAKPERIRKDQAIILNRVRKACQHKRWRHAPWHIEGEIPTNGQTDAKPRGVSPGREAGAAPVELLPSPDGKPSNAQLKPPDGGTLQDVPGMFPMLAGPTWQHFVTPAWPDQGTWANMTIIS